MAYSRTPLTESTQAFQSYLESALELRGSYIVALRGLNHIQAVPDKEQGLDIQYTKKDIQSMIFNRGADNLQTYITEVLNSIFHKFPHSFFKSKIDASSVFEGNDLGDVRRHIIEREVRNLSYKSLIDLNDYMSRNLRFPIFSSSLQARRVQHLFYRRNLMVHNRGRVSELFKQLTGLVHLPVASRISAPYAMRALSYFDLVATEIDVRAAQKFQLETRQGWPHG